MNTFLCAKEIICIVVAVHDAFIHMIVSFGHFLTSTNIIINLHVSYFLLLCHSLCLFLYTSQKKNGKQIYIYLCVCITSSLLWLFTNVANHRKLIWISLNLNTISINERSKATNKKKSLFVCQYLILISWQDTNPKVCVCVSAYVERRRDKHVGSNRS